MAVTTDYGVLHNQAVQALTRRHDRSAATHLGNRVAGTRRTRTDHGIEQARQAKCLQPRHAGRPVARLRPARERRLVARRRASRTRRPFHGRPGPGRCRTEHRQRGGAVSRGRPGPVAAGRRMDQAHRGRRARTVSHPGHRVAARGGHQGRRRHDPVRPDRGVARHLSVRRRHHPLSEAGADGAMRCGGY